MLLWERRLFYKGVSNLCSVLFTWKLDLMVFLILHVTGDCAELFDYCSQDLIEAKVKLLLQMSLVLIWGKSPVLGLFLFTETNYQNRCE